MIEKPHFTEQFLIVIGVINLQGSAVKCIADSTSSSSMQHLGAVPIYHGYSLQNQLLSVMAFECMDDSQI
jgi:hypothetical protein